MRPRYRFSTPLLFVVAGICWGQPYPGCPNWTHQLTFVNQGSAAVTIKEVPGCLNKNVTSPPFNGTNCWPLSKVNGSAGTGSFQVPPGPSNAVKVTVVSCYSGNFRVECSNCKSGVETLAEFTFDGGVDNNGNRLPGLLDTYDVSMVDGFSKPVLITPDLNVAGGGGTCTSAGCRSVPACPSKLQDGDACLSPNRYVVDRTDFTEVEKTKYGCVCSRTAAAACTDDNASHSVPAACVAKFGCSPFSQPGQTHPDSACCPFWDDVTQSCSATSKDRSWDQWALDYINAVHQNCPGLYAWQFDDEHGTFTCQGTATVQMNYAVTISPASVTPPPPSPIDIFRVASPAGLTTGVPLPGSLAYLFLSGLTGIDTFKSSDSPSLPLELAGVQVKVAGVPAPLFWITPRSSFQEILFQVPWESGLRYPVEVLQNGKTVSLADSSSTGWGVFFNGPDGYAVAQRAVDYSIISAANPARPGEWVVAYATNLGAVTSQPRTGGESGSNPLPRVVEQATGDTTLRYYPVLRLNGAETQTDVNYVGLTPGTVGVYQVNLRVPDAMAAGDAELFLRKAENCTSGHEGACGGLSQRLTFSWSALLPIGTKQGN